MLTVVFIILILVWIADLIVSFKRIKVATIKREQYKLDGADIDEAIYIYRALDNGNFSFYSDGKFIRGVQINGNTYMARQ